MEKKEELIQLIKDAYESYDDYRSMLGNELYDLEEQKKEYENLLKSYIDQYGCIDESIDKDIYNDCVKLLKKEDKEDDWKTKYLYLKADLENIKKRYNKQIEDIKKYKDEDLLIEIIVFLDYIEMKIKNEFLDDRLKDIYDRIIKLLESKECRLIYPKSRPAMFNEKYDNGIIYIPCNDKILDNSINSVLRKGFFYKDKILRYEEVAVNKYEENNEKK